VVLAVAGKVLLPLCGWLDRTYNPNSVERAGSSLEPRRCLMLSLFSRSFSGSGYDSKFGRRLVLFKRVLLWRDGPPELLLVSA